LEPTLPGTGLEVIDGSVVIGKSEPIVPDGRADSVLVEITYPDGSRSKARSCWVLPEPGIV